MAETDKSSQPRAGDGSSTSRPSTGGGAIVKTPALRLVALDAADLTVISAHLQDAVGQIRDMAFVPKHHRFALLMNRFDWPMAETRTSAQSYERRRCALRFEHVRAARVSGVGQGDRKLVLSLLTIGFEQSKDGDPAGVVTLQFAGGGAIRLDVDCIEAELTDLGAGWRTARKPDHPEADGGSSS